MSRAGRLDDAIDLAAAQVLAQLGLEDTAVIVCDLELLQGQLDTLTTSFGAGTEHAIAIKTMPHPSMLAHLVQRGFGLEAASMPEVRLALAAGLEPSRLVFDSPVKTRAELAEVASSAPGMLCNANSLAELERYRPHRSLRLGLRINPAVETDAPARFAVGRAGSKFGVPIAQRDEIVAAGAAAPISALHSHVGSAVGGLEGHLAAAAALVELAQAVDLDRARRGDPTRITTIDLGGGLAPDAGPTRPGEGSILESYAEALHAEVPELFDYEVVTEFGNWVHANTGWVGSRVEYVDHGPTARAYLHVGADLFLRDVYTTPREFSFAALRNGRRLEGQLHPVDLEGPLCFAGDTVARGVQLPELAEGDWVVIGRTGANTYALWSRHCSRDVPAVVAVEAGAVTTWSPRRAVC